VGLDSTPRAPHCICTAHHTPSSSPQWVVHVASGHRRASLMPVPVCALNVRVPLQIARVSLICRRVTLPPMIDELLTDGDRAAILGRQRRRPVPPPGGHPRRRTHLRDPLHCRSPSPNSSFGSRLAHPQRTRHRRQADRRNDGRSPQAVGGGGGRTAARSTRRRQAGATRRTFDGASYTSAAETATLAACQGRQRAPLSRRSAPTIGRTSRHVDAILQP
jgi:hypothetical protein